MLLAGLSDEIPVPLLSEDMAGGLGTVVLLLFIAAATAIYIYADKIIKPTIISVIPLMMAAAFQASDFVCILCTNLLLAIISIGVFALIDASSEKEAYELLLKQGSFDPEEIRKNKRTYWCWHRTFASKRRIKNIDLIPSMGYDENSERYCFLI